LNIAERVGCRCIITESYPDKVGWYAKYGFVSLEESAENKPTRRMFLDIRTLRLAATCGARISDPAQANLALGAFRAAAAAFLVKLVFVNNKGIN